MRRASITGPIILIVIGLLFLLRNFIPGLQLLDLLSQYWPYGLIAWGVLRLVEVLVWNQKGQLAARQGVTGGEWVMVVFICVVGSSLFWGIKQRNVWGNRISLGAWELMGEAFEYPVSGTMAAGKTPRILIDNARGNTRITGIDSEEVRVTGTKTIRAMSREDADLNDKKSDFQLVREGDTIIVRTNLDRVSTGPQMRANLEIQVPLGARVETKGRYGDIDLENVGGDVDINSENAGIRLNNVGGNVRADLRRSDIIRATNVKGNVEVKGRGDDVEMENISGTVSVNGSYSGDLEFRKIARQLRFEGPSTNLRVERVAGTLRFAGGSMIGSDVTGPLVLRAKSKDVELSGFTDSIDLDVDRGDITLRPSGTGFGKMEAKTNAGEIELVLPTAAKFELAAKTRRGDVENDYGSPLMKKEEDRGGNLSGNVGNGPRLLLETDRGEIRVRKSDDRFLTNEPQKPAEALPPSPPTSPLPPVPLQRSVQ
jgi:DUF4097 and DUF4098 domain-containing protein YvlB